MQRRLAEVPRRAECRRGIFPRANNCCPPSPSRRRWVQRLSIVARSFFPFSPSPPGQPQSTSLRRLCSPTKRSPGTHSFRLRGLLTRRGSPLTSLANPQDLLYRAHPLDINRTIHHERSPPSQAVHVRAQASAVDRAQPAVEGGLGTPENSN